MARGKGGKGGKAIGRAMQALGLAKADAVETDPDYHADAKALGAALGSDVSDAGGRAHLMKRVPDTIPDLVAQFAETATTEQDALVLASLDMELKAARLDWADLANLLRWQIVAHRKADVAGVVAAAKSHPNRAGRLNEWENKFLNDIARRGGLLTERQISCLQSIVDSLDMSADEFALKQVARGGAGGAGLGFVEGHGARSN